MSQSDYIKYKTVILKLIFNKFQTSLNYSDFSTVNVYYLASSIENTKDSYNNLIPPGKIVFLNITKVYIPINSLVFPPTDVRPIGNTDSSITITFTPPTGDTIDTYSITADPVTPDNPNDSPIVQTFPGYYNTCTLTGLQSDTIYLISIVSKKSTLTSVLSNIIVYPTVLSPPTFLNVRQITDTTIDISFTPPSSGDVDKYTVVATYSDNGRVVQDISGNQTNYTITGIQSNIEYTISVFARNSNGNSVPSNSITARTFLSPPGLQLTGRTTSIITLLVTGVTETTGITYYIEATDTNGIVTTKDSTEKTITLENLTSDMLYIITVYSVNAYGPSSRSLPIPVYTLLSPPTDVEHVSRTTNSITVSFTPPSNVNVVDYEIIATPSTGNIVTQVSTGTTYEITGLQSGMSYTIRVFARNANGVSAASLHLHDYTVLEPPTTLVPVGNTDASITFSFTASTGSVTGYGVIARSIYEPIGPILFTGTTYTLTNLQSDTSYNISVIAKNADVSSSESALLQYYTLLSPPRNLFITNPTDTSLFASFHAPLSGNVVEYIITTLPASSEHIVSGTTHTITGLNSNTEYTIYVYARNSRGTSAPLISTNSYKTLLSPPTFMSAIGKTDTSINISYSAPSGGLPYKYDIYISYPQRIDISQNVSDTYYNITGLTANTEYTINVVARTADGNISPPLTAVLKTLLSPPTTMTTIGKTDTSINISYSAPPGSGGSSYTYTITTSPSVTIPENINDTSYNITGLTANTEYTINVVAGTADGNTSPPLSAVIKTLLSPLSNLNVDSRTDISMIISYSQPLVGSPYTYTITTSPSVTIPENINDTSYNITGLTPNTEYTITVVARSANNNNTSQPANTTKRTLMSAPSALSATARTSSSITISFTSPSLDVIDYIVTAAASSGTIVSSSIPIATFPSYQITGLLSDNSYNISVVARNAYVFSMPSAILPYYTLLLPPRQIVVDINTITDSAIPISFSAPSRGTVGNYELTTTPTSGSPRTFTDTFYTITQLQSNISYIINIVARNNNTNESSIALVSSSYKTRLVPPTQLIVDTNTITDTSMNISFSAPSDTSLSYTYEVTASVGDGSVGPQSFSGTSYTITGLLRDTPYNISVIAKIADGNYSTALTGTARTLLPPPLNLQATGSTNTSISISFTLPTNTIPYSYNITLDPLVSGFTVQQISDTYTINGLNSGIEYTISVTTRNSAGNTSLPRTTTFVTKLLPPTSVAATDNTENSITLSFTPSVGAVDKYIIYAQPSSGTTVTKEFTQVDSSYVIDGLQTGMTYDLWVVALNAKITSVESTHVPYNTILPRPTLLNATASTSSSITISFTAPSSGTITNYTAYVTSINESDRDFIFSGTNYTILGLTSDTLYKIKVVASTNYVSSAESISIDKYTLLSHPSTLVVSNVTDTSMNIAFTAPSRGNVSEYVITTDPYSGVNISKITDTNYDLTGLQSNTSYDINVVARNSNGDSIPLTGTQRTLLKSPSQLTSILGNTSINISYLAPNDGLSYTFDISTNPATGVPITQGIISTNYNITGLQVDTSYTISVVARYTNGNRSLPLIDTYRTLLSPPLLLSKTLTDTTIDISFNAPPGGSLYKYDISTDPASSIPIEQGISATRYVITGLLVDTSYTISVVSRNATNTNTSLPLTDTYRTLLSPPTALIPTLTDTSLNITFTPSTTATVTKYEISASSIYGNIAATPITTPTYTFTGLAVDTSYTIFVVSRNADNTNTSLPLTNTYRTLLSPPTNLTNTITDTTMYIRYTRPSGGTEYRYDISTDPVSSIPIVQGIADTSYNITGLAVDTSYTIFVVSRNATNTNTSLPLTNTYRTLLSPPSELSISNITDTTIDISFNAPQGGSYYRYDISINPLGTIPIPPGITVTNYSITGLVNNTFYTIKVFSRNVDNTNISLPLTSNSVRTLLPSPMNLNITANDTSMNIAYSASTGSSVTNYEITITSTQGTIGPISNNNATSYVLTGLTKNVIYTIYVVAKNADGNFSLPLIGTSQTKLPEPTDLQTTGRTSTSIGISFFPPTDGITYFYDISYTPVSPGSSVTETTGGNVIVTFPNYTIPISGLSDTLTGVSGLQLVADGTRLVCSLRNYGYLFFYSYNGTTFTWNKTDVSQNDLGGIFSLSVTPDGSRGVLNNLYGVCYYFTWNAATQIYSGFTQTRETISRREGRGFDMTPDGNTIVFTHTNGGNPRYMYFAKWENGNYNAFTQTLDVARNYFGAGISADGSKIAYSLIGTAGVYVAYWNASANNYGLGTLISTTSTFSRHVRFSPDGNIIYNTPVSNTSRSVEYSIYNGSTYPAFTSLPTTSMPANIDTGGFFVQQDGSIGIGVGNSIYICDVTTLSSKAYNINGLQGGTSYTISVNTRNEDNNVSLPKTTTYNTLLLPPESVEGVSRTENSITISFTEPSGPIFSYIVSATYGGIPIAPQTFSAPRTTCEITGLQNGRPYAITVVSKNEVTTSVNSTSIVYYTVLSTPTLTSNSSTNSSISGSYTPSSPTVTRYTIQATPDRIGLGTVTQYIDNPTYVAYPVAYTIDGLESNTFYTISIFATNANGNSGTSTTTYYTVILPPTLLTSIGRTTNSIDISFNAPSGATADFYTIKGVYSGGYITDISFNPSGSSTVYETYSITGLLPGTQYSINVYATNANSTSSASNQLIYSTLIPPPTYLMKTAIAETTMDISFNKPAGTITTYTVNASYSGGSITQQTFNSTADSSVYQTYQITGLLSNTSYTVDVVANNTDISTFSAPSTSITHSTLVAAPSNVIPLSSNPSTSTIDILFNKSYGTITSYTVNASYSGGSIGPLTINPSVDSNAYETYKISGLREGTKYTITVSATNGSLISSPSSSILYATNPSPPSGLAVTAKTTTSLTISVTLPTVYDAISYFAVEINDVNNPIRYIYPPFTAPTTTFVIDGLTGNTQYSISVKSYITVPSIPVTIPATNFIISSVATSTIVDRTLLPSPRYLQPTGRTGTSITIAVDPPTDGIPYTYDISYTPISAGSSVSEIVGGITNVSFPNYTIPISGLSDTLTGLSSIQLVDDGKRLVCSARNYGYLFFYSYNGTTWNKRVVSQNDLGGIFSLSVTPDGSRGVLHGFYGLCYYFTWNASTQIYSGFTQTRETISRREGCGFDMTPNGDTIILTHTNDLKPRYMYFAKWENGNYNAFTQTLDVSRNYIGAGISADGSKIAYALQDIGTVYVAYWNTSANNYGVGTAISTTSTFSRHVRFSPDGKIIYNTPAINASRSVEYSIYNGSTYPAFTSLPTTSMPANIDTGGFFVQTDGSICIGVANNIYRCAVTTTSSKAYNINGLQSFTSYTISVNTRNTENNISLPVTTTYSTLLPEPTYLIATGRTTNSIDISFNKSAGTIDRYTVNATYSGGSITPQTITPSIDSNAYQTYTITGLISNTKYTINVYATRGSVNSSYSNNIVDYSTLVVQTASFSTNPFTNVFTSVTAGISSLSINNNRTRITVSSTSQQNIYYYTYNGTAWVRNAVSISIPSIISMAMTPDGSRGVIGGSDNKCYYFTLTGSTYSTLRQTLDTRSLGLCRGIDITDNGNTIVYTDEVTNSIYFAKWNESAINYDAFTKTLDISRNTYYGLGISSDGSKIAYGQSPGNKVYVAYWNDSDNNYGVGTPITFLGSKFARHIRFSPNGNVIYMSMLNDLNGSIQYSIFNIDTYSTFKYVPTTILQANVDIAGIYVDPSGVFIFRGQAIHLITPTYTPPAT